MTTRAAVTIVVGWSLFLGVGVAQQKEPAKEKPPSKQAGRPSPAAARALEQYSFTCQPCHGPDGTGILPDTDLTSGKRKHGSTLAAIAKTISEGVPGTAMLPAKDRFSTAEIMELARLVQSFDKTRKKPPVKK